MQLANGSVLVPMRAEGEGVIGDGMVEICPDDPEFAEWAAESVGPINLDAYGHEEWIKGHGSD